MWRWRHMCMSSPLIMPQLRVGNQLRPVGLAAVICQVLVPFMAGTGSYSQLAWLWPPRRPFSSPELHRHGWMSSTVWIAGGLLLCWTHRPSWLQQLRPIAMPIAWPVGRQYYRWGSWRTSPSPKWDYFFSFYYVQKLLTWHSSTDTSVYKISWKKYITLANMM